MAQDYNSASSKYKALFNGQSRSGTVASVTGNEQFDRDNILYFLEERFKTNGKTPPQLEDLRAIIHILVKSVPNIVDDKQRVVVNALSGRISTTAADRWYYNDVTYGWSDESYTSYKSDTINSTTPPNIASIYGVSGFVIPFEVHDFSITGQVQNDTSSGDVDIIFFYSDIDDGTNSYLQNMVFIGEATVDCSTTDTGYSFSIGTTVKVPAGKVIWMLIKNTGWTSGTEYIKYSMTMYGQTKSPSWSAT
jgi:hypothetical protein